MPVRAESVEQKTAVASYALGPRQTEDLLRDSSVKKGGDLHSTLLYNDVMLDAHLESELGSASYY